MDFSVVYRTVACFGAEAEAELVRAQLAAEGIAAAVRGELDAETRVGGELVRVLVPSPDLERARTLLAPTRPPVPLEGEGPLPLDASSRAWIAASMVLGVALALSLAFLALSLR